ncbi:MAG: bifunctional diguanylate cyclase/phosphodiesterase [Bacillota bacterium]|nr:bifunctional diguanylate cyclase/phosphodiesterase [Bacillota bacterium]
MNLNNKSNKHKKNGNDSQINTCLFSNIFVNKNKPLKITLIIVLIYTFMGSLWISLSDYIMHYFIKYKNILFNVVKIKDGIYIFITSLLLFVLIYYIFKRINSSEKQLLASFSDLSSAHKELMSVYLELRSKDEELQFNLYHDFLTNLPNKLMFKNDFNNLTKESNDVTFSILFIDIDNFKYINDNFGHTFGDNIILEISSRINLVLNNKLRLYRFGGDEFIVLAHSIDSVDQLTEYSHKILNSLKTPIEIDNNSILTSLSIGISRYPSNGKTIDELLKKADISMYKAKNHGKDTFIFYDESMNQILTKRLSIEKNLRTALTNNEFLLYYQPQYTASTGEISSFESLIRWKSSNLGFVSPNDFIPIAEDINLIIPIGNWVLINACSFIKYINDKFNQTYTISVNISMLQLMQNDFIDTVNDALNSAGLNPKFLELEITESILMQSFNTISDKLETLKNNGIKIALDDFGKGYSSFNYLIQLPITTLKIDKTFIDNISIDSKSNFIVGSMISLGRNVGLNIVAEGVESHDQLQCLIKYKCDLIQGYYFSKPVPENDVEVLVSNSIL